MSAVALDRVLWLLEAHPEGLTAMRIWEDLNGLGHDIRFPAARQALNHALMFGQVRMEKVDETELYFFV